VPLNPMALAGNWTQLAKDVSVSEGTHHATRPSTWSGQQQQARTCARGYSYGSNRKPLPTAEDFAAYRRKLQPKDATTFRRPIPPANARPREQQQPVVRPALSCQRCSDLGWVRLDVEPGHPEFGRAIRCSYKAAEDRAQRAKLAHAARNLSGRLLTKTFANFDCGRSDSAQAACGVLRAFADAPEGWVLLLGNRGTGKTHLLAAVANELLARGEMAMYVVVPDFLDYLRSGYDSERFSESASLRMEDCRNTPVLLLDDLGSEKSSPWTDEQLYRLLNHRSNEGLPTVVASNVMPDALEPRIASRLQDAALARVVLLEGEDQRLAKYVGMSLENTRHT
jgi:DNA replication protein DnaC